MGDAAGNSRKTLASKYTSGLHGSPQPRNPHSISVLRQFLQINISQHKPRVNHPHRNTKMVAKLGANPLASAELRRRSQMPEGHLPQFLSLRADSSWPRQLLRGEATKKNETKKGIQIVGCHFPLSPSRKEIASSSTRTASITGTTGRASNTKAGNIEQNL
jgi:hypothetical protein